MSTNINQIFGTVILSLILLMGSLYAFAQDDEEEEPEQQLEEEQEKEEQKDSKDEDESTKDEDEKEEEQQITNETIQETAQQIIQTELDKAGITTTNESQQQEPQPVVNPPQEIVTTQTQPVANDKMQFDATCNCTTATNPTTSQPQPIMQPTLTPQTAQNNNVIQQIPITTANIVDSNSVGKVVDPAYTNYYTVSNLFDNVVNDVSFWSQAGNSGFSVQLDTTLDDYQVCSIELNSIHNPKNVPFIVDVGISKNYTGILDQANERIQFDNCVKNMDQILMIFNSGNLISDDFVSIGEIKLFGSKLGVDQPPPPSTTTPTPTQPQQGPYKNATKINISNSEAQIDIKNSTITLKFDKDAAQATNYNVITIPDAKVVN